MDTIAREKARYPPERTPRSAHRFHIFGEVCPKQGRGAALILPACNTEAMNLHFAEIATHAPQQIGSTIACAWSIHELSLQVRHGQSRGMRRLLEIGPRPVTTLRILVVRRPH